MGAKLQQQNVEFKLAEKGLQLLEPYKLTHLNHRIRCRCGTIFTPRLNAIFSGKTSSCGCFQKQRMREVLSLTDSDVKSRVKERNILLIDKYKGRTVLVHKFKCYCGTFFEAPLVGILNGETRSCGCSSRGSNNWRWKGHKDLTGTYWKQVRFGAKKRALELKITIGEAWNLFVAQNKKCALSGEVIAFSSLSKDQTASLDRIDSSKGYIPGNVQWIHKDVNQMKMDLDENRFKAWCRKISSFQMEK